MLFVIHGFDKPDRAELRSKNYPDHKAHVTNAENFGIAIVMSGPLVADDGETPIGSHFVIEAPDREAVERFHEADPFFIAGVWERTSVTMFLRRR